jgi:imidazolonepropionase-like amidohydrolase
MAELRVEESPVLYHGRAVFDGTTMRQGHGVLVEAGRVTAVGPVGDLAATGVRTRSFDGYLVPGFVDAHTHVTIRPGEGDQHGQLAKPAVWQTIRGVQNLRRMLASGVTTARIMTEAHDIDYEFRDAIAKGEVAGPRLLVAGPGLSPPGGHGSGNGGVKGVDALRAAVRRRAARGADHIKIFTTGGVSSVGSSLAASNYSGEEIAAIVDEAAKAGLKVSSHAHGGPGVDLAVANGILSIEHGALLDDGNIAAMVEHDTWLTLTNTILFHPTGIEQGDARVPQIMAKVQEARNYVEANVHKVREAGLRLALGTDSMHGLFGYEMVWLVQHGWDPLDALVAGTSGGARMIGQTGAGVLAEGSRADFVVLADDPLADITAVQRVAGVFVAGQELVTGDGEVRTLAPAVAVAA